jgi:hypothetical protein
MFNWFYFSNPHATQTGLSTISDFWDGLGLAAPWRVSRIFCPPAFMKPL